MSEPLEKLVVSGTELDRELIATTLANLVRIDKDKGEIRLTLEAIQLPKKLQILIYLTGRKAATALGILPGEPIAPKDLASQLGMGGSSIRGQLFTLSKERLIGSESGKYWVPNYAIERVKALLEQATRKEG